MPGRFAVALVFLAGCGDGEDGDDQPDLVDVDAAPPDGDPSVCPGPDPSLCPSQEACDRGECVDIDFYVCERGEWVPVICEGVFVDVVGTWTVSQSIQDADPGCPELVPRDPIVFTVTYDTEYVVTAEPPMTIVSASASGNWERGTLSASTTDDWNGVAVTLDYDLAVDETRSVYGTAIVTSPCTASLVVTGTLTPP